MPTQLSIYNGALLLLGQRNLSALASPAAEESQRVLDAVYNGGGVEYCLEQGQWNFAIRASMLGYESSVEPSFGYSRAFTKPTDLLTLCAICSDEYFNFPLTAYADEAGNWYSDLDEIYIRYVSSDAAYGGDLTNWPETFTRFVEAYFAFRVMKRITGKAPDQADKADLRRLLVDARSKDAMAGPTAFPPAGNWRRSRSGGRGDRGNRGSLIG